MLIIVGVIIAIAISTIILPMLQLRPPGNPPVTSPPTGHRDIVYHEEHVSIEANSDLGRLSNCIINKSFTTEGGSVCFYGNYTSNRPTRFFITDQTGFQEIEDSGSTDRVAINFDDIYGYSWEFILPPFQNGTLVNTWYVVISAFGYSITEWDRDVSYYICQDKTAPYANLDVPRSSEGIVNLSLTVRDLHCNIQEVTVSRNTTVIYNNPSINTRYFEHTIIWNTSEIPNGYYLFSVEAIDQVGNEFTYQWETNVNNPIPEDVQPQSFEISIQVLPLIFGVALIFISLTVDVEGKPKRVAVILVAGTSNLLLALSTGLEPHEILGAIVDILTILGMGIACIRWYLKRREKKKELERLKPKHDPSYYH
jgi:hypothetical protein